jgi:hypothetical protein
LQRFSPDRRLLIWLKRDENKNLLEFVISQFSGTAFQPL